MLGKVVYYALVSFEGYNPGDIILGANDWPFINGYVSEGRVAPVLVCTLPVETQEALAGEFEEETEAEEEADESDEQAEGAGNDASPDDGAFIVQVGETELIVESVEAANAFYDGYTVPQLTEEAGSREGVEIASGALKQDVIDALIEWDQSADEDEGTGDTE